MYRLLHYILVLLLGHFVVASNLHESDFSLSSCCFINYFCIKCCFCGCEWILVICCRWDLLFSPVFYCSFTFKTFQSKSSVSWQSVHYWGSFKSSAVAGDDACRIHGLASVFNILSVFVRIARCQSFGFFSIVESETLWQVKL